jgi:hypothetical protein
MLLQLLTEPVLVLTLTSNKCEASGIHLFVEVKRVGNHLSW